MNNKKSLGQISPIILILIVGVIVFTSVIVIFFITARKPSQPVSEEVKPKVPVFERNLGNIKVKLIRAEDLGNVILGSESKAPLSAKDVTTTEKFIKVTVSAENIGKNETGYGEWDIGEIVDGDGRKFLYAEKFNLWLPAQNGCKNYLKPGFTPVFCTKIYEVAKISKNLKIKLISSKTGITGPEEFIDLGL